MRSSFIGFEVQKRSLNIAQKALDIVGNNLSNEKTPGYTRQRVDVHSLSISSYTYWQTRLSKLSLAGQGVSAFGVSQIRNAYIDKRYRDMAPVQKEYDVKIKALCELETALDAIDNYSLSDALNELKSALQQVSLERPDALEMTSIVRNQVDQICKMLRVYSGELNRLLENNLGELESAITGANTLIDRIADYNKAIVGQYILDAGRIASGKGVSEYGPLELIDQRNLLLDELSQYGNIEVFQNANGSVRVTMAGQTIIDDQEVQKIVMRNYDDYNAAYLTFSNGVEFIPKTGEIKAFMDIVNGNGPYAIGAYQNSSYGIPYYLQALDAFADGFAELMNGVNKGNLDTYQMWNRSLITGGYALDQSGMKIPLYDNGNPPQPMFDDEGNPMYLKAKVTAANIRISDEWRDNVMMIGETFNYRSISEYAVGANYERGNVFRDPMTGLYYIVNNNYTASGIARDDFFAGHITEIDIFRDVPAPGDYSSATTYAAGDRFFDPNTGIYYEVTGALAPPTTIADAIISGDITAIGIHEGEWRRANLDGTNLHRFVDALESHRSWGRALDYGGNAFGYLEFISNRLGMQIEHLEYDLYSAMDTVNILLDNRAAVSAVSEDEEAINMLTYQKWYNASARLMTTLDEALDTVINRMGRVGL